jgi:hypothetical protein
MDELEQRNRVWLEWMRRTLRAYWLFVVDGQVVLHGESPKDFPSPDDIETLCQRLSKVPLWYEPSPTIEEGTAWQPTIYPDDAYPTLTVVFSDGGQRWETVADFDIGAGGSIQLHNISPEGLKFMGVRQRGDQWC